MYYIIFIRKFNTYFNGSTCTLLSFFEHVNQGVDATVLPRWGGTEEIKKALVGIDLVSTKFNTIYDSDYTNNLLPHKAECDNGIVLMVMIRVATQRMKCRSL